MKNKFKIVVTALTLTAAASSFSSGADAMMMKKHMGSMQPMMCGMPRGHEKAGHAGRGLLCVSKHQSKMMMMKYHMSFKPMMCMKPAGKEKAGHAGYGLMCKPM